MDVSSSFFLLFLYITLLVTESSFFSYFIFKELTSSIQRLLIFPCQPYLYVTLPLFISFLFYSCGIFFYCPLFFFISLSHIIFSCVPLASFLFNAALIFFKFPLIFFSFPSIHSFPNIIPFTSRMLYKNIKLYRPSHSLDLLFYPTRKNGIQT